MIKTLIVAATTGDMRMTKLEKFLKEAKERREKATPGPWKLEIEQPRQGDKHIVFKIMVPYTGPVSKDECETAILKTHSGGFWNGFSTMSIEDMLFVGFAPQTQEKLERMLELAHYVLSAMSKAPQIDLKQLHIATKLCLSQLDEIAGEE